MKVTEENLVRLLAAASGNKRLLERRLVHLGLGVLCALQKGEMDFDDARRELFNVDNYLAAKQLKLSPQFIEFFQWGMELEDVAGLAPGGLGESYWRMNQLASRMMRNPIEKSRRRSA
jgi:hypothetical protein